MMMLVVPIVQAVTFWLLLTHPTPTLTMVTVHGVGSQEQMIEAPKMTLKRKLALLPKLLKYMVPLALVYFFEYFINQGLVEISKFSCINDFLKNIFFPVRTNRVPQLLVESLRAISLAAG